VTLHLDEDHTYRLIQLDNSGCILNQKDGVRSAVYNSDSRTILAGTEFGIEVLDASDFSVKNELQISLPGLHERVEVDRYRTLWLDEPQGSSLLLFVAYFDN
jgi:hypothetical protein